MKRFLSLVVLCALVIGASASLALAQGTAPATDTKATAATSTTAKPHMHHAAMKPRVDINTASAEDLEKLPGIDEATAGKIVAGRPYKSRTELVKNNILTKAQYAKISTKIMAKAAAATK